MATEDSARERARELFADFVARGESGEASDIEALLALHPELTDELRRLHHSWRRLERDLAGIDPGSDRRPPDPGGAALEAADARRLQRLAARSSGAPRYRIEGELGRGGMGRVHEAFDVDLERRVALKVAELAGAPGSRARAARLSRFLREARIAGRLQHPAIVPVLELGVDAAGDPYFTMPVVRGRDLRSIFEWTRDEREGWNRTRALSVLLEVCNALAYAHSRGVVHRDLKPANVMVGEYGAVHVVDWGLAKVLGEPDAAGGLGPPASDGADAASPTREDEVLGTPAYMPPEQARGKGAVVDERADVYAIGALLYHLLAHAPPYADRPRSGSSHALVIALLAGPPTPLAAVAPDAPPELVAICARAMAREPADRYPSAAALGEDLRAWLEGRVVSAHGASAFTALRKWVARNRGLAAALGLLIAGAPIFASLATYVAATRDEVLAAERQARAERMEMLLEEGFLELGEGDPQRARRAFEDALALERATDEAWAGAVLAELALGRPEGALTTLDAAASVGVELAELALLRSDALRALGREEDARAFAERAAGEPSTPAGAYVLAERELAREHRGEPSDLARAAELMLRAVHRSRAARPLYWYGLAHARGHAEEPQACEEVAAVIASLWPDQPGAQHWTGFALASTARPERSLAYFERAVAARPENVVYRFGLAGELARAGELERAAAMLRELAEQDPPRPAVLDELARILLLLGRYDEAVEVARACALAHPERAKARHQLADALHRAGHYDEAFAAYEQGLQSFPDDARLRRSYALKLRAQGKHAQAIAELELAVQRAPDYAAAHADLAVAREESGDLDGWRASTDAALRLDPRNATALIALGRRAARAGDPAAALAQYQRAAEAEPEAAIPAYNVGHALLALDRVDEAIEAFARAAELDPELAEAHCNLGHALRARGRFAEALEAFRRGHELGSRRAGWTYESADWVREVEALLTCGPRIDAALRGERESAPAERARLARFALELDRPDDAARLFESALEADERLGDLGKDMEERLLHWAARAAARASQAESLEPARHAKLCELAFAWLERDLFQLDEALESGALPPGVVRGALTELERAADLAPLRDADALGALPADLGEGLRELWLALADLRARATERSER